MELNQALNNLKTNETLYLKVKNNTNDFYRIKRKNDNLFHLITLKLEPSQPGSSIMRYELCDDTLDIRTEGTITLLNIIYNNSDETSFYKFTTVYKLLLNTFQSEYDNLLG
jgi:hypothetical protein